MSSIASQYRTICANPCRLWEYKDTLCMAFVRFVRFVVH